MPVRILNLLFKFPKFHRHDVYFVLFWRNCLSVTDFSFAHSSLKNMLVLFSRPTFFRKRNVRLKEAKQEEEKSISIFSYALTFNGCSFRCPENIILVQSKTGKVWGISLCSLPDFIKNYNRQNKKKKAWKTALL